MRYLLLLALAAPTCTHTTFPEIDGGPSTGCSRADKHLNELLLANPNDPVCKKLVKTPAGKTFKAACVEIEQAGVPLNTSCITSASTCTIADACSR